MSEPRTHDRRYDQALKKASQEGVQLEAVAPLLLAAHESGDSRATYALATWYLHGKFFKKDIRRSTSLLREAAKHQNPDALFDLAVCYEKGQGVAKNLKKAFELYVRAALHGEKQSVYEVGRCYYHGIGVERDRDLARLWLDRARELGVTSP